MRMVWKEAIAACCRKLSQHLSWFWGSSSKTSQSVAGVQAEIRTQDLYNMARGSRQLCLRLLESNLVLDTSLQFPLTCLCPCQTAQYHKSAVSSDMFVPLSICTVSHHAGSRSQCVHAFTLAALSRIIFRSVGRTLLFLRVPLQLLGECQSLEFWGVEDGGGGELLTS